MGSKGAGVPLVSTESDVLVADCKGAGVPLVSVESDVTDCKGGTLVTVLESEVWVCMVKILTESEDVSDIGFGGPRETAKWLVVV